MFLNKKRNLVFIALFFLIAIVFNLITHVFDNKYYGYDANGAGGVCSISLKQAEETRCLISGFEFYKDQLYTPDELTAQQPIPDTIIDIGRYKGFELDDPNGDPHGSGTYRLLVLLEPEERSYALDLPEIFSSYRLYVNGSLLVENGNPEKASYQPEIISTVATFQAANQAEIVLQVADYSHYYSGMIYPPAFGTATAVQKLVNTRNFVSNCAMVFALLIAMLYLIIYLVGNREKKYLLVFAICVSYLFYVSYPVVHAMFSIHSFFWYRIEDLGLLGMLAFLTLFVAGHKSVIRTGLLFLFGATALLILAFPVLPAALSVYRVYGIWMDMTKLLAFVYIMICSVQNVYQRRGHRKLILFAVIFFAVSVAFDYPGMWYEPRILGWGAATGGIVLCICIGIDLFLEILSIKKQNARMITQVAETKRYLREVIHDLKSPLIGITSMMELAELGIRNDEEAFREIRSRATELAHRIDRLTEEQIRARDVLHMSEVESIDFLENIADQYRPIAQMRGIVIRVSGKSFVRQFDAEKITLALENLIINAIRYSKEHSEIHLKAFRDHTGHGFHVCDFGCGMKPACSSIMFSPGTSTQPGHMGLGLSIAEHIMDLHGGVLSVTTIEGEGCTFSLTFEECTALKENAEIK